jgi:bacteriocin biosynthesis cyclodehydratase domain-containing protein
MLDQRPDGVCLYLPSEGRGFVARGLTGHLLTQLRDRFGDETFGLADLDRLDGGVEARAWRRLVKELCARGAVTRPDGDQEPPGTEPVAPVVGVVGDHDFFGLLQRELPTDGELDVRVLAEAGRPWDPERQLGGAWRDVTLVVSFDSQPNAAPTRALNRAVVAARRRHLPVRILGRATEIGPLVVPGDSACFECYWWRRQAQFGETRPVSAELLDGLVAGTTGRPDRAAMALARTHARLEVGRAIGLEPDVPESLGAVVTAHVHPLSVRTRPVLRLHDCPACAPAGPA